MKEIRFSHHALQQMQLRGTNKSEVINAIRYGNREPTKRNLYLYRYNVEYNGIWQNKHYPIKQVVPVAAEEQ